MLPRSKPDAKTVVVSFLSKKKKKKGKNLLWQSFTSRSIFIAVAGSRGQSLTEVEGRISRENKGVCRVERRAAGFCCAPCGLEPPDAPPPSVCLACEILHCRCLRENTLKSRNVLQKNKQKNLTSNKQEIVWTPLLLLYSEIYSVTCFLY